MSRTFYTAIFFLTTCIISSAQNTSGEHDFDFEIGNWKTYVKRLTNPLEPTENWTEMNGISKVTKIWGGRANMVELIADGPTGHFEGLNLRLYNPASKQWNLNFASARGGVMTTPTIGSFRNGRGEFYSQETLNERAIFVRFIITVLDPDTLRFEQAFSGDGGATWQVNWIATDTRIKD